MSNKKETTGKRYRLSFMSDDDIVKMSNGEVVSPSVWNTRGDRPETGGLLCEQIFGTMKNYSCRCKQLQGMSKVGKCCNNCHVEVQPATVRDEWWGHIELGRKVINPMAMKALGEFLGIPQKVLGGIVNRDHMYKLVNIDEVEINLLGLDDALSVKIGDSVFSEDVQHVIMTVKIPFTHKPDDVIDYNTFTVEMMENGWGLGTHQLHQLTTQLDSEFTLRNRQTDASLAYANVKGFLIEDLFISKIPVTPANMRPLNFSPDNQIDSPKNELLKRLIRVNARVRHIEGIYEEEWESEKELKIFLNDPDKVVSMATACQIAYSVLERSLQISVSNLFLEGSTSRRLGKLESNISRLGGKEGRFRSNLLGKRVDYSGRSVVASNPECKITEIGVPRGMMIELMRPHIIGRMKRHHGMTSRGALKCWQSKRPLAYSTLDDLVAGRGIDGEIREEDKILMMTNRAPSLHQYSVQAMTATMHEGKQLKLPVEVASYFNQDNDGDQMAVHLVIGKKARKEARELLTANNILLQKRNGSAGFSLSHEQVVGIYDLTLPPSKIFEDVRAIISDSAESAIMEWDMKKESGEFNGKLWKDKVHFPVKLRVKGKDGKREWVDTTYGRCRVYEALGGNVGWEMINGEMDKGKIGEVLKAMIEVPELTSEECLELTHNLVLLGFEQGTKHGLSLGMGDFSAPSTRDGKLAEGEKFELENKQNPEKVARNWARLTDEVERDYIRETPDSNPMKFMYRTKSRVSENQIRQMMIWKGQLGTGTGGTVMVKSSLQDGLSPLEYLLSCKGAISSLNANNEIVPQSGYLCRQLVGAEKELSVSRSGDTVAANGLLVDPEKAIGRYTLSNGHLITAENLPRLRRVDERVEIQSIVTGIGGVTSKEIGTDKTIRLDISKGITKEEERVCRVGTQVGVASGQVLAEFLTQLSLRSKHRSGAIDIGSTSLRIVQFSEDGKIEELENSKLGKVVRVKVREDDKSLGEYIVPKGYMLEFKIGQKVKRGELLAEFPDDIQGADVGNTVPQIINIMGAKNPGFSYTTPHCILATMDGEVEYRVIQVDMEKKNYEFNLPLSRSVPYIEEHVEISINGEYIGTSPINNPIFYKEGKKVKVGDKLTFGTPKVAEFWGASGQDVQATWDVFYRELDDLYEGKIDMIHFEVLFRSMIDVAQLQSGERVAMSSLSEEDSLWERLQENEPERRRVTEFTPVGSVPDKYPSWLKSVANSGVKRGLVDAVTKRKLSNGCPTERLITGDLIPSTLGIE